jgi:hypothetical protein
VTNATDGTNKAEAGENALSELARAMADRIPVRRAAEALGLHSSALHRARKDGKLECFRVCGRWFTTVAALRMMITRSSRHQ